MDTKSTTSRLFLVLLWAANFFRCTNYVNYPIHPQDEKPSVSLFLALNPFQFSENARGALITILSGSIYYEEKFISSSRRKGITFILSGDPETESFAQNSQNRLLREGPYGTVFPAYSCRNVIAAEFETEESFPEETDYQQIHQIDIDSRVFSLKHISLAIANVSTSRSESVTAIYEKEPMMLSLYVFLSYMKSVPIMISFDLSLYVPPLVYAGVHPYSPLDGEVVFYSIGHGVLWSLVIESLIVAFIAAGVIGYRCWRANFKCVSDDDTFIDQEIEESSLGPKKFRLKELQAATGNFLKKNEIGRGGFGVVYKGSLNGTGVAIKRIADNTHQGKNELIAEVNTMGSLRHKNLVKLIGWCHERNKLLLVYELMPNGSLDSVLFSDDEEGHNQASEATVIKWEKRYHIIYGTAQAIDYLHNGCSKRVLHRDIKASNILLDSDFNARLGDFGLARMFSLAEKTHHSTTQIAGTPGYMAPEIFHTGRTSAETDVYSFGVLILVIVCGKDIAIQSRADGRHSYIVDWVWESHRLGEITEAIDAKLNGGFDREQAGRVLLLGLACCHPVPCIRPSMRAALQILSGDALPPPIPPEKPAFVWPDTSPTMNCELNHSDVGILSQCSSFSGR